MNYLFFGYLAGFLLVAGFVARLALRLGSIEQRLSRLQPPPEQRDGR